MHAYTGRAPHMKSDLDFFLDANYSRRQADDANVAAASRGV